MTKDLAKTKAVLVTGASRGIGAAISMDLAKKGYQVVCLSRSGSMPEVPGLMSERYPRAIKDRLIPVAGDVTSRADMESAVREITAKGLTLAGIVNNAGIHSDCASTELTVESFRETLDVNTIAVLQGCQVVYPELVKGGGGLIVNIGSFFDKLGVKRNLAYCASKAAVGALTRVLAVEWAKYGIRVLNVAPGYIATDLNRESMDRGPLSEYLAKRIPGGKPGEASDVSALVVSLFEIDTAFLTGETLYVDGGQGVAH